MTGTVQAIFAIPGDLATPTGGYAYARRLIELLPAHGVAVEVLALPDGFPLPGVAALDAAQEAIAAAVSCPADGPRVLLADGLALAAFADYPALDPCGRLPLVVLCHHPSVLEQGMPAADRDRAGVAERAALAHAASCITTSRATVDALAEVYGYPPDRCTVAQPGTDPAPRAQGSGGPGCHILTVGSLTERKGHDRLLAALAGLADLDWYWTLVGPHRDPAVVTRLTAAIRAAGLGHRVTLTGALDGPALEAAFARADLFVLASSYEGFGMVFTEAMARSLPVVGLTQPAVAEATRGGALLVAPDALPDTLRRLVGSAEARAALAARCAAAADGFQRWQGTAAEVAGVLRVQAR